MPSDLRRILLEAAIIFLVGVAVGLSFNYELIMGVWKGEPAPTRTTMETDGALEEAIPAPVFLNQLDELVAQGGVFVDARAVEIYEEGHLPKALSLPLGEFETAIPPFRENVPEETMLIVYCSGFGCTDSFDLGVLLLAEGYRDVRVFEGGFPEWRDAGRPVEEGAP